MTAETLVTLLRAVNLGAHNKVPMAKLREHLTALGAARLSTYIASGNIICVPPGDPDAFGPQVEELIRREFDVETDAISRTHDELDAARAAFPFDIHEAKLCAISFLKQDPAPGAAKALADGAFGDDRCDLIGRELHLRYESAVHSSKLTNSVLARILGTPATARNVRTVEKLIALSA